MNRLNLSITMQWQRVNPYLTHLDKWQREHQYPLNLHTEASINLADDEDLLDLFVEANIQALFVGIESPNTASLIETKKLQNTNRQDKQTNLSSSSAESFLLEKIRKI